MTSEKRAWHPDCSIDGSSLSRHFRTPMPFPYLSVIPADAGIHNEETGWTNDRNLPMRPLRTRTVISRVDQSVKSRKRELL